MKTLAKVIAAPTVEPVTIDEARAHLESQVGDLERRVAAQNLQLQQLYLWWQMHLQLNCSRLARILH